jgi:hypothetical protein
MAERSGILSADAACALSGALPARFRMSGWRLLYSTERHGISLQTLYRRWQRHCDACVTQLVLVQHQQSSAEGGRPVF